ncbi:MAG: hypothetical protein NTV72_02725 [Candidatus Taylorbacteria bacterium]|nr:hypothetical protein [Candidatus Taylorbacteria bacterium]
MNSKNLLTIVIIIALVGGGVWWYRNKYNQQQTVISNDLSSMSVVNDSGVGAQTMMLLGQVKSLKLDDSIFKDSSFQSLQDYSRIIPDQPVGRPNPFAPINRGYVSPASVPATSTPASRIPAKATTTKPLK